MGVGTAQGKEGAWARSGGGPACPGRSYAIIFIPQHLQQRVGWTEQPKNLGDRTQVIEWAGDSLKTSVSPASAKASFLQ